jgi:transcriptional regulator with AAA-type ATPase domain
MGPPCLTAPSSGARAVVVRGTDGHLTRLLEDGRLLLDGSGRVVGAVRTFHRLARADGVEIPRAGEGPDGRAAGDCRLHALIAGSLDQGNVVLTCDGTVAAIGARATCLLGSPAARGRRFADLVAAPAPVEEALAAVLAGAGERELSGVAPAHGGRTVDLRIRPLAGPGGALLGARVEVAQAREPLAVAGGTVHGMVCASPSMRRVAALVDGLAACDATVLLTGESGTGKEVVARAIHTAGPRAPRPFHAVNCAALGGELLESELFGHERGAFTGAVREKPGRLEVCADGTLLLDEVDCLPLALQAKLLRVLDAREFERVGGTRTHRLRARIVAATNADLACAVAQGAFRADLYYRLAVVPLELPPLRARPEDVVPLASLFARQLAGAAVRLTPAAEAALVSHAWPGNVRELRNAVQFALALGARAVIDTADLPPTVRGAAPVHELPTSERRTIEIALERSGTNRVEAARQLGMSRTTLWRRMRELGIG